MSKTIRNAVVHLGHSKTGSSFLQVCFAKNLNLLRENGWLYPESKNLLAAQREQPTTGNGNLLLNDKYLKGISKGNFALSKLKEFFNVYKNHNVRSVLFSDETLSIRLSNNRKLRENIINSFKDANIQLTFVMYTRDLFEHSSSAWGQSIKNSGKTDRYDKRMLNPSIGNEYIIYQRLLKWIKFSEKEGLNLKIFNYENHKSNLFEHFFKNVLKIDNYGSFYIPTKDVNVSLGMREHEVLRLMNLFLLKHFDRSNEYYSRDLRSVRMLTRVLQRLCNRKTFPTNLSLVNYEKIKRRYKDSIDQINKSPLISEKIKISDYAELKIDDRLDLIFPEPQINKIFMCFNDILDNLQTKDICEIYAIKDLAEKITENNLKKSRKLNDKLLKRIEMKV